MIAAKLFYILLYLFIFSSFFSQNDSLLYYKISKIKDKLVIDGKIDSIWYTIPSVKGFKQQKPFYGEKPLYDTEVKIAYDNNSIYILAIMYVDNPSEVRTQYGERDENNLDADYFKIAFDTYNKQNDAYIFGVTASNVQIDLKFSDNSYNAVWYSETSIENDYWLAEIMIPFSEIKFSKNNSVWRFQCQRIIRKNREISSIVLEPLYDNNVLKYWAYLVGIEDISSETMIKLKPYFASGILYDDKKLNYYYKGGMDLTYSLSESHNLTLMLLPDFSQVQSDDKYKNLSAFETVYDEQRQFFKEANEYFNKNNVFYSRRVGKIPSLFYEVENMVNSNAIIKKNPYQQQIISAFKLYGRNNNGLAIGILNATTANTYCEYVENDTLKKLLTEPWANYNVFIIDKAYKGGNNFYFINSNFLRNYKYKNSNVFSTGGNFIINNKWQISPCFSNTLRYLPLNSNENELPGFSHSLDMNKISGKYIYGIGYSFMDKNFNANDIGLTLYNNYLNNNLYFGFRQNEPFKNILSYYMALNLFNNYNASAMHLSSSTLSFNYSGNTKKYFSFWGNIAGNFFETRDYYEPRVAGYYFRSGKRFEFNIGTSTDYRKPLAIDFSGFFAHNFDYYSNYFNIEISPLIRFSNRLKFRYGFETSYYDDDLGYVFYQNHFIYFGKRDVKTIENRFSVIYNFSSKTYFKIRARHNWSNGKYKSIYTLNNDGTLSKNISYSFLPSSFNYNFNALNVDFTFYVEIMPGNFFMFIYKFEIFSDEINNSIGNYVSNIEHLPDLSSTNTLLIKFLWYINAGRIIKKH